MAPAEGDGVGGVGQIGLRQVQLMLLGGQPVGDSRSHPHKLAVVGGELDERAARSNALGAGHRGQLRSRSRRIACDSRFRYAQAMFPHGAFGPKRVLVRDASPRDIPALTAIRYNDGMHRDRIRDASEGALRYLLIEADGRAAGFGCLVLGQPQNWPPLKAEHLPKMIDLYIREDLRGRQLGTRLIREMERLAREAGHVEMYMEVDPKDNPRALELYTRLGYASVDREPVETRWDFVDSDGVRHVGVEWTIHMKKSLA